MNQLSNQVKTIDSREVAEMLGKRHDLLLREIEGSKDGKTVGIIPTLLTANFAVSDYFIESDYKDASGKSNKCYLITKMGCEMLGNKQQGEKGILFTAKYVKRFNEMENHIKSTSQVQVAPQLKDKNDAVKLKRLEIMDMNARTRQANMVLKIQEKHGKNLSKQANQTLLAYSTKLLTGQFLIELPQVDKLYSATEIAEMVGSNKTMVGRVANANNLKIDGVHGMTVMDKSPYSSKEVTCFKYNEFGKKALIKAFNSKNRDGEVVN